MEKSEMYRKYSEGVPEKLISDVFDFLLFMNQQVIVAPYEADAQLAALWIDGKVDWVVSEDSDLLAFGCLKLIRGVKSDGKCQSLNLLDKKSGDPRVQTIFGLSWLISICGPAEIFHHVRLRLPGKR